MDQLLVSFLLFNLSGEHPVHRSNCGKIFLSYPGGTLAWVSPSGPPPHLLEDRTIHGVKGLATCPEAMIGGPSSYNRVELYHQVPGRAVLVFLDDSSNLFQECFHILLRRGRQDRSALVLAYTLSKEVEAVLNMRDNRFLLREGESSLFHESFNERFDLLFQ